jgi:exopolyphosphatase / guanosine-5'-triphosphate,3'-diphosphate pyrophosphatase
VDVGCVRLTERHLVEDPPTAAQVAAAREDIRTALDLAGEVVPFSSAATVVGLAGSVTTVAAAALDLPGYQPERIHHARIPAPQVHAVTDSLLAMPRKERARLPYMHPGRVDVIGSGALILDEVMRRVGRPDVLVSEHDILDGIAWSLVEAVTERP